MPAFLRAGLVGLALLLEVPGVRQWPGAALFYYHQLQTASPAALC